MDAKRREDIELDPMGSDFYVQLQPMSDVIIADPESVPEQPQQDQELSEP